jgi:twinkle protein
MFTNLNELKNIVKIEDVVSKFVKLKKTSGGYIGLCPFHSEKTPSFYTKKDKNNFKCFGCGVSGSAFDFVMLKNNVSFFDSVIEVAKIVNFEMEYDSKEIKKPLHRIEKLSKEFLDNFENVRKISNNTLLQFNVTEAIEWMPKAKAEIKVICFNYMRDGELINIKFRGKNKDMKMSKGAELIFYNIDAIRETEEAVIVEGEIDSLSMHEAGIYNSVSVPNGANSTKCIDNCYEYFLHKKKIIIATDNDDAGRKLRDELMFRFGVDRCYFVQFPDDCKDANDVLVKHGKEELKKIVQNAIQIPIEGLVSDKERRDRMFDLYENGMPKGTPCGIYGFDEYLRFQGGLVTTITAPPSTGKSEFLDYVISGLAVKEQWRFGVFSFENQPIELHDAKWAEKITGKAFAFRKDPNNRITKETLLKVADEIFDKFKVIEVTKVDKSVDGIIAKAEELVNKYGIKGLVIDPYNKMLHNIPSGMTETNYINLFMTKITDFAKKYNIHVFLVVHPTKPQNINGEVQKRVTLYSASGSANFYNQTDNGFTLMRNRDTGIVDVYIEKVRFSEQGKEGWVSFTFNTLTRQYKFHESKDPIQNEYQNQTTQTEMPLTDNDEFKNYDKVFNEPPF